MKLLTFSAFCTSVFVFIGAQSPCTTFTNLGESRRSISYRYNPEIEESLCDFGMTSNEWYIFNLSTPAAIPEEDVVEFYFCGTYSPIFIKKRNGESYHSEAQKNPSVVVEAPGCSNYIDLEGDCDWTETIGIQFCALESDEGYFVYNLRAPDGCPMAYCTDDKHPCKPGEYWNEEEGKCVASFPFMREPTLSGPYVVDTKDTTVCNNRIITERFAFDCNVGYDEQTVDDDARFEVQLTVDNVVVGDPIINITSLDPKYTFYEDQLQLYLGKSIGCQVRSYWSYSESDKSSARQSNTYWIAIYGESITINRETSQSGEIHNVPIYSTVPITCYHCTIDTDDSCACCKDGCVYEFSIGMGGKNLAKSNKCFVEIRNSTSTGNNFLHVGDVKVAVYDDPSLSAQSFMVEFAYYYNRACQSGEIGGRLWDGYQIDSVAVNVVEPTKSPLRCYTKNDPHIKGINGRGFTNFEQGDFRMAKVFEPEENYMEIHTRLFSCGDAQLGTCNCGVIVREGNSMLGIDACTHNGFDSSNIRQIKYLRAIMEDGTVIEDGSSMWVDTSGTKFYIIMKSGLKVYISRGFFGFDIDITFPFDYNLDNVDGMCNMLSEEELDEHRVEGDESLFNQQPPQCLDWESVTTPALTCECEKDNTLQCGEDDDALGPSYEKAALKESAFQCEFNVIKKKKVNELNKNGFYYASRRTNQDKSDDLLDLSEIYYEFDYDKNKGKNFTITWPTPSGITEAQAQDSCSNSLHSSKVYTECDGMFDEDLLMSSCVIDINALDDLTSSDIYIDDLEKECLDTSVIQANVSSIDELRNDTKYTSIANNVCPSQCNDRGDCVNGQCECDTGYVGADCSVNSNEPPTMISIYNNGSCDLTAKYCAKITVYVDNMYNSPLLQCRYTAIPLISPTAHKTEIYFTNATFVNARQLNCPTPPTKIGASYSYQLAITNDGVLFSAELPYVIYDLNCFEQQNGMWLQKTGTCLHNDVCYTRDQRQSDVNCFVCTSDDQTVNQWTDTTQWQDWTNCSRSCDMGVIESHYGCSGVSYEVELRSCHLKNCTDRPEYETEGVELTFYDGDSLLQSLYKSNELFYEVSRAVNDYCSNNTEECCPQMNPGANREVDITNEWLIDFDTGDPHVYINVFFMRLLVTTQQANLEKLCGLEKHGVIFAKTDTPLFVPSDAVVSAVTLAKSDIEQALGITIGSIN